jgi:hypothetical protein
LIPAFKPAFHLPLIEGAADGLGGLLSAGVSTDLKRLHRCGDQSYDQGQGQAAELEDSLEVAQQGIQQPGNRRVRQSPLAVLTSTPISTGPELPPQCSFHQQIASLHAASRDS